jgi:hypothetical protein
MGQQRSSFSRKPLESLFSYCKGEQIGVRDKITEEFFQSFILWKSYFRIAEVDRWEFTTRSQRSSLPTLQCRFLITFPTSGKLKGNSHEVHLGACCFKGIYNKTRRSLSTDF